MKAYTAYFQWGPPWDSIWLLPYGNDKVLPTWDRTCTLFIHMYFMPYQFYVLYLHYINDCRTLGQSDAPSDWYSGGHGFDPRSSHISFVQIWS